MENNEIGEINLNDIPLGFEDFYEMGRLQSSVLYNGINSMSSKEDKKFNYIIVSRKVLEILECNERYSHEGSLNPVGLSVVGNIGEFKVFLDPYIPDNKIILSWDKQISRDFKLDSILNNTDIKNIINLKY